MKDVEDFGDPLNYVPEGAKQDPEEAFNAADKLAYQVQYKGISYRGELLGAYETESFFSSLADHWDQQKGEKSMNCKNKMDQPQEGEKFGIWAFRVYTDDSLVSYTDPIRICKSGDEWNVPPEAAFYSKDFSPLLFM